MKRNIIKQGNNSFTITIPISWIRDNNISEGDEVEISEEDNEVIISLLDKKPLTTSIHINLKKYTERTIKNIAFQLYRKGFDNITCIVEEEKQKDILKDIVRNNLLGFEVIFEQDNKIVIESVAEPSKDKLNSLINRLFFIIKTSAEEIIKDLELNNAKNLDKHTSTKNMFDLYTNFLKRIIIKEKVGGSKNSYLYFYLISQLSYIQHSFYYAYTSFLKNHSKKVDNILIVYLQKIVNLSVLLQESLFNSDLNKAHIIGEEYLKINSELEKILEDPKIKYKGILLNIITGLRFTQLGSTCIFGLNEYK